MIDNVKKFLHKMICLWQSRNENYKNLKGGGIAFFIITFICLGISLAVSNENVILNYIFKYTSRYIGSLSFLVSINFLSFYFYVYNRKNSLSNKAKVFIIPILIFLVLTLIAAIPFTILMGIISKILNFRAKKMDNLIRIMEFLTITLISVSLLIYPNFIIAYNFAILIKYILQLKCTFNLDAFPVSLFLFISLCTVESNLVFKLLIFIKKVQLNRDKKNKIKLVKKAIEKNLDIASFDIKSYMQDKNNKMMEIDSELKKEIEYDMSYLENTLKRVELAILIILFIVIVFKIVPFELLDILNKYQSDAINVLTIYTLAMLYMDKRKEWK